MEENILIVLIMFFLISAEFWTLYKIRIYYVSLTIMLFSVIIGIGALGVENIPASPYFQVFFIVFQVILHFYLELKRKEKRFI